MDNKKLIRRKKKRKKGRLFLDFSERGARFQESEKPVSNVRILLEAWSVQVRCTQEVHYARSAQDPVARTQLHSAHVPCT